jgi:predicted XRE-type DNA-binding protein
LKTGARAWRRTCFEDLGFSPAEAAALKLKADLNTKIVKAAARYTQQELQNKLGTSQPRVSDLLRGKMSKFSLDTLVLYAELVQPVHFNLITIGPGHYAISGGRNAGTTGLAPFPRLIHDISRRRRKVKIKINGKIKIGRTKASVPTRAKVKIENKIENKIKVKGKGVGQECPTHTSLLLTQISDPRECLIFSDGDWRPDGAGPLDSRGRLSLHGCPYMALPTWLCLHGCAYWLSLNGTGGSVVSMEVALFA